ncbi:class I SAM-dependent methyltransferase [Legionella erythra]|uniref:Methyltransferase n=1 Tax=Legionella erythra TaxID=448 RepID=A0A0W0TG25_LEGER|nr:class I SAM-dependent methyltransferase [Legionella erythra]KTC94522.1 methyltransferase [Legionella erythra]
MTSHRYRDPNQYSQNNALQYTFAMQLFDRLCLDSKSSVLDLGCGDGLITNKIASIVKEGFVIGTDISRPMIEFAARQYSAKNNLRFLTMDAADNLFRDQFDIITSFNCLHWIKEQQKVLHGIAQAAVPGASIGLLLSHRKSIYHDTLERLCSNPKWAVYFENFSNPRCFFALEEYEKMLVHAGLTIHHLVEEKITYHFKSKDELKGFFNASGAHINQIQEWRKQEFLEDFVSSYLAHVECRDNSIPVTFWCLKILASKPACIHAPIY